MKLWGGRFEAGPSEIFERFSGSLDFDRRLIDADIRGSQAFARALERAGILTAEERAQIVAAFDAIRAEAAAPAFFEGATDEDVHTLVIRKLKETGRRGGRQDPHRPQPQRAGFARYAPVAARGVRPRARAAGRRDGARCSTWRRNIPDAVIPGYTHMRRAQAVLWPHYLLAYFEMFARDWERFGEARRARQRAAARLGRAGRQRISVRPRGHGARPGFRRHHRATAWTSRPTAISRSISCTPRASTMIHLSRLAEDWILYSSEEFGWLELGDGVTSGSSLMPQKKNPDSLELIRGKCGRVMGCLTSLMVTMKGLPMTYNRDMQEDKEPLFDAADQVSGSLEMARAVIGSVKLNPARPAAAAEESWVVATDLAEALARAGTPFHQAHQMVGRFVLESVRSGKKPADWTAGEMAALRARIHAAIWRRCSIRARACNRARFRAARGREAVAAALAAARSSGWRR